MYVTIVYVKVKARHIKDFIDATTANHRASIEEPGNLRFDVLQQDAEANSFVLYEAYKTKEDAALHKKTPHYQTWRETVADWMAEPRQGIVYNGLCP